jgi:hypothetical protein
MPDQLPLPFPLNPTHLADYLTRASAISREQDRLREELRLLRDEYADDLPLRALSTALKVVEARRKLAEHHTEPLAYAHQDTLQGMVEAHLARLDAETRAVPDMV